MDVHTKCETCDLIGLSRDPYWFLVQKAKDEGERNVMYCWVGLDLEYAFLVVYFVFYSLCIWVLFFYDECSYWWYHLLCRKQTCHV